MNSITDTLATALAQFHLLRPWWLLAILPAIALYALLREQKTDAGAWRRVVSPHLLPWLMHTDATTQSRTPWRLLLAGWIIASIALSGPTWRMLPSAVQKKMAARVVVFDLSTSMMAPDIAPSRLVRAKHKLSDILARSREGLTGLVVYAGTAHVASPLTDDAATVKAMVEDLSPDLMPEQGSAPVSAIELAARLLTQGANGGDILLIGDDMAANYSSALAPLRTKVRLSILGVGTAEGAPIPLEDGGYLRDSQGAVVMAGLNTDRLKGAANLLGGRYSPITADDSDLDYLLSNPLEFDQQMRDTQRQFDTWDDGGGMIALLLLPLAAAAFRRGWLGLWWLPVLALSGTPRPAHAFDLDWLWKTADQRGKQAFDAGRFKDAADTFNTPDWKAAAHYRDGHWQDAEALYGQQDTADAHYNRGNALARQGRLQEALDAYDRALSLDANHADAKANRDIVRQAQENKQSADKQQNTSDKQSGKQPGKSDKPQQPPRGGNDNAAPDQSDGQAGDQQQPPGAPGGNDKPSRDKGGQSDQQNATPGQDAGHADQSPDKPSSQAQQATPKPSEPGSEGMNQPTPSPSSGTNTAENRLKPPSETENQQALRQWLRRIPDNPGGLLRNKFYYESKLRQNSADGDRKQW